uniref:Cap-specific mRNA (nucleoside-2'-O-)-methyltransferase 2 n=1 Tax=Glossina brevipalpis TaxID=37001 RepID=A0A1A9WYX6_9MUSC
MEFNCVVIKLQKLNDYEIEDWSLHTNRKDPSGEISWRLKNETKAEFVTVAWCKFYECLGRFPQLIKGPHMNSLHLCETPGAFIAALNHFLCSRYEKGEIQRHWVGVEKFFNVHDIEKPTEWTKIK